MVERGSKLGSIGFIVAQAIGLTTGIMSIVTLCLKKRKTFLYGACIKGSINIIQLILLGEAKVVPIVLVELIRNFVYTRTKKKWVPVIFIAIMLTMCFLLYDGVKLVLLLVGYTASCICYMFQDIKKIKIFQVCNYIMWLPWDVSIKNYSKVGCHVVAIGIVLYQIIKDKKVKTESGLN